MRRVLTALALVLALPAPLSAGPTLADELGTIINASPLSRTAAVAAQVIDAETGEVLFERNPDMLFVPASNMKLYTSACALATFGADHRFETTVLLDGEAGGGGLRGDLVLRGGGDSTLRADDLRGLARRVVEELGVRSISGDVVVDVSLFADRLKGPGWMWDDDPDLYNMSISAIMLDYNVLDVLVRPGADPIASLALASAYPPIVATDRPGPVVTRLPFTDEILVRASGVGAGESSHELTMHDPARWVAGVFAQMLRDAGVTIQGEARVTHVPVSGELALTFEGLPLSEQLALFNKPSENAIGEMLIHSLAVNAGRVPATWGAGAEVISQWLTSEAGLREDQVNVVDGSGLSRYNLICAAGTCQLLRHVWQRPDRQIFVDSLPVAGVDGTIRQRMAGTPAQGNVRAKTGTMSGVSTLSGYATAAGGREIIFSILTNGLRSAAPARDLQDRFVIALVAAP
ncbi:MAG: D-alanyl-D-alanine carboxypeptidase/D-alanyl-D-alanine-endopeptidase [Candidatus Sumerlaeia bacterium]|nr:D-alanyl-D-alanine carboxypeptidase/D-alanyl-D-alanine-endopeptidase [Candidatus Sumerlaeia bacterium]